MKKALLIATLVVFGLSTVNAQNNWSRSQRTITDPGKGCKMEYRSESGNAQPTSPGTTKASLTPGTNWQAFDGAAIGEGVKVSNVSMKTLAAWWVNDRRISLFGTSNTPDWEVPMTITAWDETIDMTDDGSRMITGYNDLAEVYLPASSLPYWSVSVAPLAVRAVQIQNDGQKIFVAAADVNAQDSTILYCFNVNQETPVWRKAFAGSFSAMVINRPGTRVLLGEYGGGVNKLFVLNATNGALISELPYACQYPPAISDDGKFIVSGDFSSHAYLYEYNEASAAYVERWNYTVNGTSSWVCGMGISADGSTIAIGTLVFTSTGYDGDLYVFNNNSPTPLWIYSGMGDMVQSVDLSADGSIIAAASWGDLEDADPDLYLFRKQSSTPYYTVDSDGSLFCVDLSPDGKLCAAGGKAVHAREFGMGGNFFNVNSDLGGGTLSGNVLRSGSGQLTGSKIEIPSLNTYFTYSNETGAYNLLNIPEGTYTVRYSAVGYVTQEFADVQITNGQVSSQDVTLLPTGTPPSNLTATQGAGLSVNLTWEASSTAGVTGYNVYRKQYSFDNYPATPLGTVGAAAVSFSDTTALPLIHYYYVVTAQLPGDLQTPYSNEATGWISTGFVTHEISAYTGIAPTIDGVISPGEWSDAFKVDMSNVLGRRDNIVRPIGSVMGYFKVNADKTALYVAVDNANDTELNDHDEVALYIDDNNDGSYPAPGDTTEGNYWAVYYNSGNLIKYRPLYSTGGVGTTIELQNPQIEVSDATGHVVYEFVLPMGPDSAWMINYNENSQSGMFVFVLDDPSYYTGWWPCDNMNIFTAEGYGVITFGATDEVPPAPNNLQLANGVAEDIILYWDMPAINDFDHFNIYWSTDGGATFNLLDQTVGVQYFYTVPSNGLYQFYVTTVDNAGQESEPSNIVQADVVIGMNELHGDLSMIKMGPNPFRGALNIDVKVAKATSLSIRIMDVNGRSVATVYQADIAKGLQHFNWNGTTDAGQRLQPGVYLVRFETTTGSAKTFKLMVTE